MSNYDLFGDYEPEQPATLEEDWPEPEPAPSKPSRRKRSVASILFSVILNLIR